MSVIYRDRERDRDWDTRSSGGRTTTYRDVDRDREGYSVKKIYRIPNRDVEDDRVSLYRGDDRRLERDRDVQETRIIRRERTPEPEPERREIRIVREDRSREPEPEPRRVEREIRYERDYDRLAPSRGPYEHDHGDLQRYSRSVEYFPRPEPPQPIIIRQEPQQIIIQEAPRAPITVPAPQKEESEFQVVQRSEVVDDRQIARRPKSEKDNEEEYYYERRTREVSRDHRGRDDDYEEERFRRRERDVSPGDSISQVAARDRRRYSSDDSYDYVERRETREGYGSDEGSPHHRRHLAEGALAGVGAAELLRHHRKKEGGEEGSRRGRVGKGVGAAALGALGAEAVTRARSHYREKSKSRRGSRERSRSRDRDGRRRHRHDRSRSRSQSKSRVKQAATLGLGAAAVAAAAAYANKQRKNNDNGRRSRSRTRRQSVGAPEDADDARNPTHRNKKIAQAGLAGAAVAGLVDRARSKSRGRERSKSRIRTGLPIAAAGLGSAAIAGLYERNQAGKKEKEARREERAARRASRSRSRSQYNEGSRDQPAGDPGLIEYGDAPIYGHDGAPDYYNRPASQQGYYNNTEAAMVPAAAAGAGAAYGAPRDRERSRSISSGSDNDRRRRRRHRRHKNDSRSRSRSRGLTAAALGAGAAGAAGLAASEHEKRRQRKEEKRERKREFVMISDFDTLETFTNENKVAKKQSVGPMVTIPTLNSHTHHHQGKGIRQGLTFTPTSHSTRHLQASHTLPMRSIKLHRAHLQAPRSTQTMATRRNNREVTYLQNPTLIHLHPEPLRMRIRVQGGQTRM